MIFIKSVLSELAGRVGALLPDDYPDNTVFFEDTKKQIFFGYYDVTPFSSDNTVLLATRTDLGNASPHEEHPKLEIGYYSLKEKNPEFITIAQSSSWNWQQGCRLQWLPNKNYVVYNDYRENRFFSIVFDVFEQAEVRLLDMPVYAVAPDGTQGLGLNFSRLHSFRPGYGYSNGDGGQFSPETAIYKISFDKGSSKSLIGFDCLRQMIGTKSNVSDYINHLSYAPDSSSFLFFYIVVENGRRITRLFLADENGDNVRHLLPDYSPSHYTWHPDGNLLLTATNNITRQMEYITLKITDGTHHVLSDRFLLKDGHPGFLSKDIFLSDTYPSRLRHQTVFSYNITQRARKKIASFYLPAAFSGEKRCDMHPRLSMDTQLACIDVVRSGRRAMAVLPMTDL